MRDQLESLKRAICADAVLEETAGESVFRRTLAHSDTPETEFAVFENWLEQVRMWLMYGAEFTFTRNYEHIMAGSYTGDLTMGNNGTDMMRYLSAKSRCCIDRLLALILFINDYASIRVRALLSLYLPLESKADEYNET